MELNKVAQAINATQVDLAKQSGELFAQSEIDAGQALELFAKSVGTEPTYDTWNLCRLEFINAYVRTKPQAKGNSADQAFKRFKGRLVDAYGLEAPKAQTEGALKKAEERKAKQDALEARYAGTSTRVLKDLLSGEYQAQAKNPTKKSAILKELEKAVALRVKQEAEGQREELKAVRDELIAWIRECNDLDRLTLAHEMMNPDFDVQAETVTD
jgi:hypothetical protein